MAPVVVPLVLAYMERVRHRARYLARFTSLDRDDLEQEGMIGLVKAAERYDPSRGVPFVHVAYRWTKGAMLEAMRTARTREARMLVAYRDLISRLATEAYPEEHLDAVRTRKRVAAALEYLPPREREVIQLVYGEGLLLKEAGRRMGIGESMACRYRNRALERLRARLTEEDSDGR